MAHNTGRTNRLARETSPYLLLHRHNPVDWFAWSDEALEKARGDDKPIFLSVGYSTCYWCHVMERESFSDPATAELLNRDFVSIKLDREERPELDEIYMTATQILSGHGGWPNSVFLTPELKPFYAGTYFPPEDRHGLPGFKTLLRSLADAWNNRRPDVLVHADELAGAMRRFLEERGGGGEGLPASELAERSLRLLERRFDARAGGFGGAPKFPTPSNLFLLEALAPDRPEAARMLTATLDAMARGGIYDQLAGGFHRYATDAEWKIPHFEKMLYDNAQLLELYALEAARTGEAEPARIALETAAFMERELSAPEGGFWSAIDAETGGREGGFHAWTRAQLEEVLGAEDASYLAPLYGFDGPAFFEHDHYVLHLPAPFAEQARRRGTTREGLLAEIAPLRAKLLAARERRPRPLVDDKILTDWNGMAIAGLAVAGRGLGEPGLVARAAVAADFVLGALRPGGAPLRHAWRLGEARIDAFLADYVFLVRGLLRLFAAGGERRWLAAAVELTDEQERRLADGRGGFFVAGERPDVLFRSKEVFDGALPAANAIAVLNLIELAQTTGEPRFRLSAERALRALGPQAEQQPDAARMLCLAVRRWHDAALSAPPAPSPEALRVVTPRLELGEPGADGSRPFRLVLEIAAGWHVYAHEPGNAAAVPTRLASAGGELRGVVYPPGQTTRLGEGGETVAIYEGEVVLSGELGATAPGAPRLRLSYQACNLERCLLPVEVEVGS